MTRTMTRIILVTGGASGLGLAAARALCTDPGNTVVIASRHSASVARAVSDLSKGVHANVSGLVVDLASLASVAALADEVKKQYGRVDVLLCNAGITGPAKLTLSPDGFEATFATNHLGHLFLIDKFLTGGKTPPSRIVVVSSGTHDPASRSGAPAPAWTNAAAWANPPSASYNAGTAYTNSKLANAMTGRYLSRTLDAARTTVAIYDPGFCGETGLLRSAAALQPLLKFVIERVIRLLAWWHRVPVQNSSVARSGPFLARLCVDPALTSTTGQYYVIDTPRRVSPVADTEAYQQALVSDSRTLISGKGFDF